MITEIFRFFSMVVALFNMCNSNAFNRAQCMKDWDKWLWPEIVRAWELKSGKEVPYQEEKDKLQSQHGPNQTK